MNHNLFIASYSGLYQFDKNLNFKKKHFHSRDSSVLSVPSIDNSLIEKIFPSRIPNHLWVITLSGLNLFDINQNLFYPIKNTHSSYSIGDNYITAILEDKQDILWIGSRMTGINKFCTTLKTFYPI